MSKHILFVFIAIINLQMYGQKLVYTANGAITYSNGTNLSKTQVETILKDNQVLLRNYVAGKSKQSVGNIMFYGGLTILATDFSIGYFGPKVINYPTFLTIVGITTTLIAIPVKMGFQKKIKNVVAEYNTQNGFTYHQKKDSKLEMITTNNGIGMRLTFN